MNASTPVEIQFNKSKLTLLFLGSIILIGLGVFLLIKPPLSNNSIIGNSLTFKIIGLFFVLGFSSFGFLLYKKLKVSTPGFFISDLGVTDNSSLSSVGFVPWTDILNIREVKVAKELQIIIVVRNPQHYIDNESDVKKRKILQLNNTKFGSIIRISDKKLDCSINELKSMLDDKFWIINIAPQRIVS